MARLFKLTEDGFDTEGLQAALIGHAMKLKIVPKSYVKKERSC